MWEIIKSLFSCNSVENISSVFMNALLVGLFLCVFFFTYVSSVEGDIVVNQIKFLADNFSQSVKLMPQEIQDAIKTEINNTQLPDFTAVNTQIDASNSKIIKNSLILVGSILAGAMILIYILSTKYLCGFSFWNMLGKNLIILTFIALTEFTFLNLIPRNYMSVDPNYVKYYTVNQLYPNTSNAVLPEMDINLANIPIGEYYATQKNIQSEFASKSEINNVNSLKNIAGEYGDSYLLNN